MAPSTVVSLFGLLVAFSIPALGVLRRRAADAEPVTWPTVRRSLALNAALLVAVVVVFTVTGSHSDLGVRVPTVDVLLDPVAVALAAYGGMMVLVPFLGRYWGTPTTDPASLVVLDQPLARRLAVGVTGATFESVLYYGVALESVLALGGGPVVAGSVAAAALVVARARWGVTTALLWLPVAVVFSAVTLLAGTAVPVLVARLLYDVSAFAYGDGDDVAGAETA